ncbi:MAG: DUF4920 domain-containing protein [Lysobacteraceae bacterium]
MRQLNVAAALVLGLILARPTFASEQFGAPMPEGEATPLHSAIAELDAHDDEREKFAGRIVEICQNKGCWMLLESEGVSARVMMHDHEFSVRKDATGTAVVWGKLFEHRLSEKQRAHLQEESKGLAVPEVEYRIDTFSVVFEG